MQDDIRARHGNHLQSQDRTHNVILQPRQRGLEGTLAGCTFFQHRELLHSTLLYISDFIPRELATVDYVNDTSQWLLSSYWHCHLLFERVSLIRPGHFR